MKYFIIFIIIGIVLCANNKCTNDHTQIFNQYQGHFNELYQRNTFGGYLDNKCLSLGSDYRKKYIEILKQNDIKCSGLWCLNGEYSCKDVGNKCYQVEHIVDRVNTPYDTCDIRKYKKVYKNPIIIILMCLFLL